MSLTDKIPTENLIVDLSTTIIFNLYITVLL